MLVCRASLPKNGISLPLSAAIRQAANLIKFPGNLQRVSRWQSTPAHLDRVNHHEQAYPVRSRPLRFSLTIETRPLPMPRSLIAVLAPWVLGGRSAASASGGYTSAAGLCADDSIRNARSA
jgi:hypothetical protein